MANPVEFRFNLIPIKVRPSTSEIQSSLDRSRACGRSRGFLVHKVTNDLPAFVFKEDRDQRPGVSDDHG